MSENSLLSKNLHYLMDKQGLNANSLQDKSNITQTTTSRILNGTTRNPRDHIIQQYAKFFDVSIADLRYKDLAHQEKITTKPSFEPQINPDEITKMEFWHEETPLRDGEFEVPYYKNIEFLGGGGWADEAYDDGRCKLRYTYESASRAGANPRKIICTTLKGDSMEELILDGSMIAIDTSKTTIKEGKVYAFRHGMILRVKYLIPRPDGGLIIRSHNEKYKDEIIAGDMMEHENIQVIGWVWNWSSLVTW